MNLKKIRSICLALAMVTALLPISFSASAEDVKKSVPFFFYDESAKSVAKGSCTVYTLLSDTMTTWESGKWYVAEGTVTIPSRVTSVGDVYLILADGCELTVTGGINVGFGESLCIFGQEKGNGKLIADASQSGKQSGIGGRSVHGHRDCGTVNIYGGAVTARGGESGAGIGGSGGGNGGTLNVSGGRVDAFGGKSGAGIGAGSGISTTKSGTLNVSGGYVYARGGEDGAGIGGGHDTPGGTLNISGGYVYAWGGKNGAGVGGGQGAGGGTVRISGGSLEATGGYGGAGIGGGQYGAGGTVTVRGGRIKAWGGDDAAGIGHGKESDSKGTITVADGLRLLDRNRKEFIEKSEETAWADALSGGSASFCALGDSIPYLCYDAKTNALKEETCDDFTILSNKVTKITDGWYVVFDKVEVGVFGIKGDVRLILYDGSELISNGGLRVTDKNSLTVYAQSDGDDAGKLTATGDFYAAGIGSELDDAGGTVTIHSGNVKASGTVRGAGIGGGYCASGGTVTVYGGTVEAIGGECGAGIGGGQYNAGGTVGIYGGKVTAKGGSGIPGIGSGGKYDDGRGTLTIGGQLSVTDNKTGKKIEKSDGTEWIDVVTSENVTICGDGTNVHYEKYENGAFITKACEDTPYTVYPKANQWEEEWYEVKGTIQMDSVEVNGDVNLILRDGCRLTVSEGIIVPRGSSLTIYGQQKGTGTLIANASYGNAAIGSAEGTVTIHGGTITATAEGTGAGIGGSEGSTGGNIVIYGGKVTARGGENGGAGIGSGYFDVTCHYDDWECGYIPEETGSAGTITIYGGNITATGGYSAAGIGGGFGCDAGTVAIHGGTVTANGGAAAWDLPDGIGCGWYEAVDETDGFILQCSPVEGGLVTIDGGTVTSNGKAVFPLLTLALDGKDYTVTAIGKNAGTGVVTVALYDGTDKKRLLELAAFDLKAGDEPKGTFTADGGYAEAFWWSDLSKMKPLCKPAEAVIK